jgi:hypothetical protein
MHCEKMHYCDNSILISALCSWWCIKQQQQQETLQHKAFSGPYHKLIALFAILTKGCITFFYLLQRAGPS